MANKSAYYHCNLEGHALQSLKCSEVVEPHLKVVVSQYAVMCIKCGKTLAEVRAELPTVVTKGKTNDSNE